MTQKLDSLFDNYGIKTVTVTDKSHNAYVPNGKQREAIAAAGVTPASARPTPPVLLTVLLDPSRQAIESGYYHARRSAKAARLPEPRMGKDLISHWLEPGDLVLIGNVGPQLFTCKLSGAQDMDQRIADELAHRIERKTIVARANAAKGPPESRVTRRTEFVRNPFVVLGALERAGDKCETPHCHHALFSKENGSPYLEVHHIVPLSENGHDELVNAAALCPHCHRELHHGVNRLALRATLKKHIAGKSLS